MPNPIVYADDPDAHVVYPITDANGGALNFTAVVIVGRGTSAVEVTASWVGTTTTEGGTSSRDLSIPLTGRTPGGYRLRLKVPGDNDLDVGFVQVR